MRDREASAGFAKLSFLAVVLALCLVAGQAFAAKNIILMIGDGMGVGQTNAGSYYLTGAVGGMCFQPYYAGTVRTNSLSGVTDSAAATTALATGHKVNNGVISQAPNGTPYQTILEQAKALGKRIGLVTTVSSSDATPAGFGAHEADRGNTAGIIGDYLNSSMPNIVFGGGSGGYNASQFIAKGYQVVYNYTQMNALNSATTAFALGLFASGDMTYEYDRAVGNTEPHLTQMATKSLSIVANDPDGFFIMIEGGLIDHACHNSNINRCTREVVEFNNSVQAVLNWMQGRNDTLLIVTADHETGGLSVTGNGAGNYPTATWTGGGGHTGANVPIYVYGANSNLINNYLVGGAMENTDVYQFMNVALNTPVPEPSGMIVCSTGLLFLCAAARSRIGRISQK